MAKFVARIADSLWFTDRRHFVATAHAQTNNQWITKVYLTRYKNCKQIKLVIELWPVQFEN